MNRTVVAGLALILIAAPAAAQNESSNANNKINPGLVGPGSPIYGLEIAYDNAAMSVGLKNAGSVAQERAAEARKAMNNNNTQGAQRAAQALDNTASKAKEADSEGLTRAMEMMNQTIADAPNEQARQGMETALQNMREAMQRQEQARNRGNQTDRPQEGQRGERPNRTGVQENRTQDRQQDGNTTDRNETSDSDTNESRESGQQNRP